MPPASDKIGAVIYSSDIVSILLESDRLPPDLSIIPVKTCFLGFTVLVFSVIILLEGRFFSKGIDLQDGRV